MLLQKSAKVTVERYACHNLGGHIMCDKDMNVTDDFMCDKSTNVTVDLMCDEAV